MAAGVDGDKLHELESKYRHFISDDFEMNAEKVRNNLVFVIAAFLTEEKPELASEILRANKSLFRQLLKTLKDLRVQKELLSNSDNSQLVGFDANVLRNTLNSDPLMYILFYDAMYQAKVIIHEYALAGKRKGPRGYARKKAIAAILCDFVNLLKNAGIQHPYDKSAKAFNLLAEDILLPISV